MSDAKESTWDAADFGGLRSTPDPLDGIELFYEDPNALLDWCGRGAACLCSAGASHVMCVVIPAVTGGLSGGAGWLAPSAAMYVLSPAFALAANAGIDRWKNIKRDAKSLITSTAISTVVAVGLTFAINTVSGHDHIDNSRKQYLDSLPPAMRAAEMVVPQQRYGRLPQSLQLRVNEAARREGLSPAEYLYFCDGSDELGRDLLAYERTRRMDQDGQLAP